MDFFKTPDDMVEWNKEAWFQQMNDWAEQNREYYAAAARLRRLLRRWNRGRYQSGTACWFCGQIPEKIQGSEEWLWDYKDCHLDHCELAEELKDESFIGT